MKKIAVLFAIAVLVAAHASAQTCRTVVYPIADPANPQVPGVTNAPSFVMPPGDSTPVLVPPSTAPVGLEFWLHMFPAAEAGRAVPAGSLSLAVYHFNPDNTLAVTSISSNTGDDVNVFKNFALSTFLNPGEYWGVHAVNKNKFPVTIFIAVTTRQCT